MITADQIKALLNLKPHPEEGGYFVETYRFHDYIREEALPDRYKGTRSYGTAIYYLLTSETFSAIHRLQSDEIFHFYLGDPIEMLQLRPEGSGRVLILGPDILNGMQPQVIVPRNVWQGSRLLQRGRLALIGTTVSTGFDGKVPPSRRDNNKYDFINPEAPPCACLPVGRGGELQSMDYESGHRDQLVVSYPKFRDLIIALTKAL